jgi:hypothetical protein
VDNEAAWMRVLGSIHAVYTRTFVAPYSSARERTRARTTSKSSVLAKAQPSAEQRNGGAENRTCRRERRKRARIAVKREEENQRAPRRRWRRDENCTGCTAPMPRTLRKARPASLRFWRGTAPHRGGAERCVGGCVSTGALRNAAKTQNPRRRGSFRTGDGAAPQGQRHAVGPPRRSNRSSPSELGADPEEAFSLAAASCASRGEPRRSPTARSAFRATGSRARRDRGARPPDDERCGSPSARSRA